MMTRSASVSPLRVQRHQVPPQLATTGLGTWCLHQSEVVRHLAILEQATRAVHEGYLGHPQYYQAAHTAQRLRALVETMAWDEGTRVAHEITSLFQTPATFGLVQAFHLSELIAAFYRGMAQVAAEQTPHRGGNTMVDYTAVPPAA